MKALILVLMVSVLTACGSSGGGSDSGKAADGTPGGNPPPNNIVPPAPTTADLTYYSLSMTEAPVAGWPLKTYTAIGSCLVYQSKTYCWDDGVKTIPAWTYNSSHYGPFSYTFWSISADTSGGGFGICHGGCGSDFMTVLKDIALQSLTLSLPSGRVQAVLTGGTPSTLTCVVTSTEVNCGSFVITL